MRETIFRSLVARIMNFETVLGTQTFPVQGGRVSVRIVDPSTNITVDIFNGATTDIAGSFRQAIRAPRIAGSYTLIVKVTDGTLIGETQSTLNVSERPDDDGGGAPAGALVRAIPNWGSTLLPVSSSKMPAPGLQRAR